MIVCLAEPVVGWFVWRNPRTGAALSLMVLPLEFASWTGFAPPLGPVMGVIRTVSPAWAIWLNTGPSSPRDAQEGDRDVNFDPAAR